MGDPFPKKEDVSKEAQKYTQGGLCRKPITWGFEVQNKWKSQKGETLKARFNL